MQVRAFIYIFCFLGLVKTAISQDLPSAYPSTIPVSFIRTWEAQSPQTDKNLMVSKAVNETRQATQYVDGLGRPIQSVLEQNSLITSGTNYDLVTSVTYDEYGRQKNDYLRFAANTTGGNASLSDGAFKLNPFQQQQFFYSNSNTASPILNQGETYYYNQAQYESSPLNRPVKNLQAGNNWVGASRGTEIKYCLNTSVDAVRIWKVTDNATLGAFGSYSSTSTDLYNAGELQKTITVDENGKQVIEFKDKGGSVILKKVQLTATADNGSGADYAGWICTYYIYDNFRQLRAVVQPVGVDWLRQNSWNLGDATILDQQTFRYEYDNRGRMIAKQVPGAKPVFMVYDKWDRLVLTQDGNQRLSNTWLYTKYDTLNRPVVTGLYTNATQTTYTTINTLVQGFVGSRFEKFQAGVNQPQYTLNQTFPAFATVAAANVLTATYYDNYNWTDNLNTAFKTKDNSFDAYLTSQNLASYPESLTQSFKTNGLVTGVWQNTTPAIYSSTIYDEKGRAIQVKSKNITGGVEIATTLYMFNGSVGVNVLSQQNGLNGQTLEVWTRYTYDNLWRMVKLEKATKHPSVNSGAISAWKTISQMTYDALGQLKNKSLGTNIGGATAALNDYDYNIRGWLLSINKDFVVQGANPTGKWFGMELSYDKSAINQTFSELNYNGNIAGQVWKAKGDGMKRAYNYLYDAANRIWKASYISTDGFDFTSYTGTSTDRNTGYDLNGNIKSMTNKGWYAGNPATTIDNLTYTYANGGNSNKLLSVADAGQSNSGLGDFSDKNTVGDDYTYDDNGNLTTDKNKKFTIATYNYLNLPTLINAKKDDFVTDKGKISYTYDNLGNKLKKVVIENSATVVAGGATSKITTTTYYLGGNIYETKFYENTTYSSLNYSDRLQFIAHEEGRIRLEQASTATCTVQPIRFIYDYFLKDHLGNTRTVLTEQNEPICYPTATNEDSTNTLEKKYYNIDDTRRTLVSSVSGAPSADFGQKFYKTNGSTTGQKTGLGILLKVMAGDKVTVYAKSYYNTGGTTPTNTYSLVAADIFSALVASQGFPVGKITETGLGSIAGNTTAINTFLTNNNAGTGKPKAFLNYMLFDEQFKYQSGNADPVGANAITEVHDNFIDSKSPINVAKSGYVYIYVSNESNINVFFDNLVVTHTSGPLVEETHYYPFGLTIAGISSGAKTILDNKFEYNGKEKQEKEFSDELGLDQYDYGARMYDMQIGRFSVQDRFSDKYLNNTPYQYGANNPIKYIDVNGDSLIVVGSDQAVQGFESIVNNGLGGYFNLQQNESGTYSLNSTGKKGEMTKEQMAFFNAINNVITGDKDVSLIAVMNDEKVDIGSFSSGKIDVGDMMKFNSINDNNHSGSTREGLLAHEVDEQKQLQTSGINRADESAKLNAFGKMHQHAIEVENSVNGNARIPEMERSRMGDKTYSKYFIGKSGLTVETTTNGTKDMQINKRSIRLSIIKVQ